MSKQSEAAAGLDREAVDVNNVLTNLPCPSLPKGATPEDYLVSKCKVALVNAYGDSYSEKIRVRYNYELDTIVRRSMAKVFLFWCEMADWARGQGILMYGQGQTPGSLICFILGITDIDPVENGLYFDRFWLYDETRPVPNIDVAVPASRRDDVIKHIKSLYGTKNVALVSTVAKTLPYEALYLAAEDLDTPKTVFESVKHAYLACGCPTFAEALARSVELSGLCQENKHAKALVDNAKFLAGEVAYRSIHSSAVAVTTSPIAKLTELLPKRVLGLPVTRGDWAALERQGIQKFDFIPDWRLDELAWTCKEVGVAPYEIPLNNRFAFDQFSSGDPGKARIYEDPRNIEFLKKARPSSVAELATCMTLCRPYAEEAASEYLEAKAGMPARGPVEAKLKDLLCDTYGIVVFQEQVMLVSVAIAGFSEEEAAQFRLAIWKGGDALAPWRAKWDAGALKNEIEPEVSDEIWDVLLFSSLYALPKSHMLFTAGIEAKLSWLSAHHPDEFEYQPF